MAYHIRVSRLLTLQVGSWLAKGSLFAILTQVAKLMKAACPPSAGKRTIWVGCLAKLPPGSDPYHFYSNFIDQGKSCGHTQLQKGSEAESHQFPGQKGVWTVLMTATCITGRPACPQVRIYFIQHSENLFSRRAKLKTACLLISLHHWSITQIFNEKIQI